MVDRFYRKAFVLLLIDCFYGLCTRTRVHECVCVFVFVITLKVVANENLIFFRFRRKTTTFMNITYKQRYLGRFFNATQHADPLRFTRLAHTQQGEKKPYREYSEYTVTVKTEFRSARSP